MEIELTIMFKISNPTFNLKCVKKIKKCYSTKKNQKNHHDFNLLERISISVKRNANVDI